jgi:hypothetical protein
MSGVYGVFQYTFDGAGLLVRPYAVILEPKRHAYFNLETLQPWMLVYRVTPMYVQQ